jgi:hypothetical protein
MPGATSPWRVNDVVAYDLMREAAASACAMLLAIGQTGTSEAGAARSELALLRREVLSMDAYDRAAVKALAARIDLRITELKGRTS